MAQNQQSYPASVGSVPSSDSGRTQYVSFSGASHSYSAEETKAFSEYLNQLLASDPDLSDILPLNPTDESLFKAASKGLLLCKLINAIKPGTIDEKRLVKPRNKFDLLGLHNLAIQGAKELGVTIINIGPTDLEAGTPHLVLGLVWQIVKMGLLSQVNIDLHPELVTLLAENEDVKKFMNVAPEQNLLRWFNYHLRRVGHPRTVNNFSGDIKDAENYLVLLSQIAPKFCPREAFRDPDPRRRAEAVCAFADKMGCKHFVTPEDILAGNEKLNLAFTAYLFNKYPGLEVTEDNLTAQRQLQQAEDLLKQKFAQEDEARRLRWQAEENVRQSRWQAEEDERRRRAADEDAQRRHKLAEEEARMRATLSEQERLQREALQREAEERARKLQQMEQEARHQAELARRDAEQRERARFEEEERRRRWDAEQRRLQLLAQEEAARRDQEMRRKEEDRRRQWDEYHRQEAAKAAAAEQHRQEAWAQYNAQQQAEVQRQAEYFQQQQWTQFQIQQQQQQIAMQQTFTTIHHLPPPPPPAFVTIVETPFLL